MKRGKKILIIVIVIVALIVVGKLIIDASKKNSSDLGTSNLATAEVTRGSLKVTVSGNGKVEFLEREDLVAKTIATVSKVNVSDGDFVKKGDIIAQIDMSDIISAKQDELKILKNRIDLQQVSVKEQVRSLDEIKRIKDNTTVASDYTGILSEFTIRAGDNVLEDQRYGAIKDNSKVKLTLPFEKSQIANLKIGHRVNIYLIDYLDKDVKTQGEVVSIKNSQDGGQVIADVEVVLDLKDGFEAGANASFSVMVNGIVIPPLTTGKIEWIDTYTLNSKEKGRVKEVFVEQGDEITKGDIIFTLENKNIDLDIEKAQYALEGAQIELDNLNEQLRRLNNDLDDIIAESFIESPFDGRVSNLEIKQGDDTEIGTIIATVYSNAELVVPIQIDELDITKVEVGQSAEVRLDALQDGIFTGKVDDIAIEGVNTMGIGSFEVVIQLSDYKGIKPGMSANVEILISEKAHALILPIEAVRQVDDEYMVKIAKNDESQGADTVQEQMVLVKVGLVSDSFVEILEGLSEGDEVIIAGQEPSYDFMMPGMYIEQ